MSYVVFKPFTSVFSRIRLILCIVSFYFPGLIHPADVFRRVTFTKVNQNLTEQSLPLAQTVPQGGRMVQHQGGSVELLTCRGSEGLPQRHIGDVINPALSNQKTWWNLGCQWLQQCGVLQEL